MALNSKAFDRLKRRKEGKSIESSSEDENEAFFDDPYEYDSGVDDFVVGDDGIYYILYI